MNRMTSSMGEPGSVAHVKGEQECLFPRRSIMDLMDNDVAKVPAAHRWRAPLSGSDPSMDAAQSCRRVHLARSDPIRLRL